MTLLNVLLFIANITNTTLLNVLLFIAGASIAFPMILCIFSIIFTKKDAKVTIKESLTKKIVSYVLLAGIPSVLFTGAYLYAQTHTNTFYFKELSNYTSLAEFNSRLLDVVDECMTNSSCSEDLYENQQDFVYNLHEIKNILKNNSNTEEKVQKLHAKFLINNQSKIETLYTRLNKQNPLTISSEEAKEGKCGANLYLGYCYSLNIDLVK